MSLCNQILEQEDFTGEENYFKHLIKAKEIIKEKTDPFFEPFMRSCGHVAHIKCIEENSVSTEHKIRSLYDQNEFSCSLCKSPVSLPLIYYRKDEELYAKFDQIYNVIFSKYSENSLSTDLVSFFNKLNAKCYLIPQQYGKNILFTHDKEELQIAKETRTLLYQGAFKFLQLNMEHKENQAKCKVKFNETQLGISENFLDAALSS